jgi:predicted NAD/FAD-binding protein
MRIAIIGSGIAGLVTGHLLSGEHDVVLFEANDYLGGHTHSIRLEQAGREYIIDTGFTVFNHEHYPNFVKVLDRAGIKSQPTGSGLGLRNERTGREFSTASPAAWFAQRSNFFRPSMYETMIDAARFRSQARDFLQTKDPGVTMRDLVARRTYSRAFREGFLRALMEAPWTSDQVNPWDMPAKHFLDFFECHGLLEFKNAPEWRVIRGGAFRYIGKLIPPMQQKLRLRTPVARIRRYVDRVEIIPNNGAPETFEHLIVATAADAALAMLDEPTRPEQELLGAFPYQANEVVVHTDVSLLPKQKRARAGWNCLIPADPKACPIITHNLNLLQGLDAPEPFLLTFNGTHRIAPEKILWRHTYQHPVLTWKALSVQRRYGEINGFNRTHYCGAYWGSGTHEDAINSALMVCHDFHKRL